jgi:Flp pilus assembly pilin Flp
MKKFIFRLNAFFKSERGTSATQYAILVFGVAVGLIAVFFAFTGTINASFIYIVNTIRNAVGGS